MMLVYTQDGQMSTIAMFGVILSLLLAAHAYIYIYIYIYIHI